MVGKGYMRGSLDYMLLVCFSHPPELDTGPRLVLALRGAWQEQRLLGRLGSWGEGPGPAGDERAEPFLMHEVQAGQSPALAAGPRAFWGFRRLG